jgi:hypothetical protein
LTSRGVCGIISTQQRKEVIKMIKVNDFVIVESKEEFEKYLHPYDKDRFDGAILPSSFNLETTKFPLALELCPSWDAHFADSWEVSELDTATRKMIEELNEQIERRKNLLKKLLEMS